MDEVTKLKKKPSKVLAVELLVYNPELSMQQIADKLCISKACLEKWKQDPNFVDAVYDKYMVSFGLEIPMVLDSMIREAKAGNVQAGRLVLEHSGKLVKNINVTIDSPFEKFLKAVPEAEVVEDEDIIDAVEIIDDSFEQLPPRKVEDQKERTRNETIATKELIKKAERNAKQKNWYRWRVRAKKVGVEPLKGRRPTPAQRQDWEQRIIEAERLGDSE